MKRWGGFPRAAALSKKDGKANGPGYSGESQLPENPDACHRCGDPEVLNLTRLRGVIAADCGNDPGADLQRLRFSPQEPGGKGCAARPPPRSSKMGLRGADLSGADLSGANAKLGAFQAPAWWQPTCAMPISSAIFDRADLANAKLNGAYLFGANLIGTQAGRGFQPRLPEGHPDGGSIFRGFAGRTVLRGVLMDAKLMSTDLSAPTSPVHQPKMPIFSGSPPSHPRLAGRRCATRNLLLISGDAICHADLWNARFDQVANLRLQSPGPWPGGSANPESPEKGDPIQSR